MTALVWLRRDLRLHDHPALRAALAADDLIVPVFCFDQRLLAGRHSSGPRTQFMLECLTDLDRSLRQRGSQLVVRHGDPERELPALAEALDARSLHLSGDVGPFARWRDARVRRALEPAGVEMNSHPGTFVTDDLAAIRSSAGGAYQVFTPFHRAWLRQPRRDVLAAPRALAALPANLDPGRLPGLSDLGLSQELTDPAPGGEQVARESLGALLAPTLRDYAGKRDALGAPSTSRLSAYLRFGCVSPRELEHRLGHGASADALRRQLCWRDFYAQVLASFPGNARSEHQVRYRGVIRWSRAERTFAAWREGRTGFPLVDAGMRQLQREGWMHNRARMVVGSFLTKDLGIDWRWGERWFMRLLLDGDQASNNGNWQWIASVGVDPQPPARRIFNPVLQQARFDPDGAYVRRYVPQLRSVPDRYLGQPWTMPKSVQAEAACLIGRDYPAPIVDHALARREALARYGLAR